MVWLYILSWYRAYLLTFHIQFIMSSGNKLKKKNMLTKNHLIRILNGNDSNSHLYNVLFES